jgi:hypothetical protein
MESTGSGSRSTAPTYPGSPSRPSLGAIRDEEKKKGTVKCKFCPRVFASLRGRGGHVKVHKNENQKQPMHRRPAPPPPPVRVWSTLSKDPRLRSACRNLHAERLNAWRGPSATSATCLWRSPGQAAMIPLNRHLRPRDAAGPKMEAILEACICAK